MPGCGQREYPVDHIIHNGGRLNTLRKVLLTVALAGSGVAYGADPPLLSLTMEHFRDTATVKDDALGTVATISTQNGYQEKRGLLRIVWNDTFLRGFIDKATGRRTFQVYQLIPTRALVGDIMN